MPPRGGVAAILDVDGTLVDTNYQHALAWYRAFREHGVVVPLWRLHRHVGMGSDTFIRAVAGEEVDDDLREPVTTAHDALYMSGIDEVAPLPGARELLHELKGRGHRVVLATSARPEELDHYLRLLDARDVVDEWTVAADVERSKPQPDVVLTALEKAATEDAVMVGDSSWDCVAAARAGLRTIGVLSGGFCEQELREAGASWIFETADELRTHLHETPLGRDESGAA